MIYNKKKYQTEHPTIYFWLEFFFFLTFIDDKITLYCTYYRIKK